MFNLEAVVPTFDVISEFKTLIGTIDFNIIPMLFLAVLAATIGPSILMAVAKKGQSYLKGSINRM